MMNRILRHSLPVRAWAAVFAISALCLISALSSGLLAWVSQADAQAINSAGSIRMATYRINFQLANDFDDDYLAGLDMGLVADDSASHNQGSTQDSSKNSNQNNSDQSKPAIVLSLVEDMENRLASLREYQLNYANQHEAINSQFERIESQWFGNLKPALLSQNKQVFYTFSSQYIEDVDSFVSELQYRNEQRQTWQQSLQLASIILTIIVMLVGMYKLRRNVLIPVQQLIEANHQFKQDKHNTRVSIAGYEEFNALGESFNDMASTIETYQHSLNSEVNTKTLHLVKANQVLSLFYDFSKHLTTSKVSLHKLDSLITDFGEIFPHLDFTLCLQNNALHNKDSIALHDDKMKELCSKLNCDNCSIKEDIYTQTYPIAHQNDEFGELKVRPKSILLMSSRSKSDVNKSADNEKSVSPAQRIKTIEIDSTYLDTENSELIIALTNLISTALSLRKQRQQEHQLILFEERSTIARELHDSLAQSLSYLKIQVSVLERHLSNVSDKECSTVISQYIEQIKAGLSSAYQQLRDLLVTFRLTIDSDNFDDALHEAANEFAAKGNFNVVVNNRVMTLNLNANEQVNLIQIAREALSNISRHAQAINVAIELGYDETDEHIVMQIIDDGIGISGTVDQTQHHGLMIMKERARNLGGNVALSDNETTGTIVTTTFTPNFFSDYTTLQTSNSPNHESI